MDNVFYSKGCPAKGMGGGRNFTDWNPHGGQDIYFMEKLGAATEHDYRKKLQQNGDDIIKKATLYFMSTSTCQCNGVSCTLSEKS